MMADLLTQSRHGILSSMLAMSFHSVNQSWKLSSVGHQDEGENVPSDAVLDAYEKGKEKGRETLHKVLTQQLHANIQRAMKDADKVIEYLVEKQNILPLSVHLNPITLDRFKVLFVIPEKDFISDRIDDVYDFLNFAETAWSEDLYNVSFSFAYAKEGADFNYDLLRADGYAFKANPVIPKR